MKHKTPNANTHWHALLEGRMREQVVCEGREEAKADEGKNAQTRWRCLENSSGHCRAIVGYAR
jgi:hypothetical protein